MLSRALKMAFWVVYDHLGKLMLANVIWFVLCVVPLSVSLAALLTGEPAMIRTLGLPLLFVSCALLGPVATVGLAHMVNELIDKRDGSLADMFRGMRAYWRPAVGVGFIGFLAAVCLPVSAAFYITRIESLWLEYAISAFALWGMVFLGLVGMFVFPALVQKKGGALDSIKTAALLVLDNPVLSLGLAIQLVLWGVVSVPPIVLVLLTASVAVTLVSSAYEMLSRKYEAIRLSQDPNATSARPIHVTYQNGKLKWDDEKDEYLNRGLRDMLFPWKG